jgi:hypothetical protein
LAHRISFDGEVLEPELPATAAAQCEGVIGAAHVQVVREFFHHLPSCVDTATRAQAETELAAHARVLRPDQLRKVAQRVEAIINPDGTFNEADRARRRTFIMGRQGPDLMSKCTLIADPELRAYLEATFAKLAKPGMCNPDDTIRQVDGEPDPEAAQRDPRSGGQRQHDALKTVARAMLASGDLGQHRGIPVSVVATTTLQDLEDAVGSADPASGSDRLFVSGPPVVTGGGSLLPMHDLIRMAAHAYHYLAIFDDTDGRPLYLGRTKRIATADQRIILHARDIGCTHPGCTIPGYLCQTHHRDEWAHGGMTDADQLTFACEPHHRLIGSGDMQWATVPAPADHPTPGRTQWIPPKTVDPTQSPRINHFHHPSEYLAPQHRPPDDEPGDNARTTPMPPPTRLCRNRPENTLMPRYRVDPA